MVNDYGLGILFYKLPLPKPSGGLRREYLSFMNRAFPIHTQRVSFTGVDEIGVWGVLSSHCFVLINELKEPIFGGHGRDVVPG